MSSDVMMILQIVQQFSAGGGGNSNGGARPSSGAGLVSLAPGSVCQINSSLQQQSFDKPSRSDSLVTQVRPSF
jgi:hypothetical protein